MKAADRCGDEGVKSAVLAEEDETKRLCGASPSLTRRINPSFLSSHLCSPPEPRPPPPRSDYTAEWVLCFKCQSGAGTEVCVFTTSGLLKAIRMMLALLPRSRGGAALMKSSIRHDWTLLGGTAGTLCRGDRRADRLQPLVCSTFPFHPLPPRSRPEQLGAA